MKARSFQFHLCPHRYESVFMHYERLIVAALPFTAIAACLILLRCNIVDVTRTSDYLVSASKKKKRKFSILSLAFVCSHHQHDDVEIITKTQQSPISEDSGNFSDVTYAMIAIWGVNMNATHLWTEFFLVTPLFAIVVIIRAFSLLS